MLIYIRSELNSYEYRCPIIPIHVSKLIDHGYTVYIQSSINRIYEDSEYEKMGGIITNKKWYEDEFKNSLIIGLKELDEIHMLNNHKHVYFSHSYKNQINSNKILRSFANSNSELYDFEYFLDDNGNRIIAFGFYAGYIGCCLGLLQYFTKKYTKNNISNLTPWKSTNELLNSIIKIYKKDILIAVIGSNGKSGQSIIKLLDYLELSYKCYTKEAVKINLEYFDIIYNCIKLDEKLDETWLDTNTQFIKPITIVDVSCDYTRINNPIKLYNKATTFTNPVESVNEYVDIITIDNLPSLLPKDSSDKFSEIFLKLLLNYGDNNWNNNKKIYYNMIKNII